MIGVVLGAVGGFITASLLGKKAFRLGGILTSGDEIVFTQGNARPLGRGVVLKYDDSGFYYVQVGTAKRPETTIVDAHRIINNE